MAVVVPGIAVKFAVSVPVAAVPILWHHPGADHPVDGICPLLRQTRLDASSREIVYAEPRVEPHEYFGLAPGWPAQTMTT